MPFDYAIFQELARKEYSAAAEEYKACTGARCFPYSFSEVMAVFRCFFQWYRLFCGEDHIPLRSEQIRAIIGAMPFVWDGYSEIDFPADEYPRMIEAYFSSRYRNCNYRIFHFFSGDVRRFLLYRIGYL